MTEKDPIVAAAGNEASLETAQANLVRVAKYGDRKTRDWSLYVFFRVLKASEVQAAQALLAQVLEAQAKGAAQDPRAAAEALHLFETTSIPDALDNDGETESPEQPCDNDPSYDPKKPAVAFFKWLAMISGADGNQSTTSSEANALHALPEFQKASGQSVSDPAALIASLDKVLKQKNGVDKLLHQVLMLILSHLDAPERLALIIDQLAEIGARVAGNPMAAVVLFGKLSELFQRLFANPAAAAAFITKLGASPAEIGGKVVAGGLPAVCLYELLRQSAALTNGKPGKQATKNAPTTGAALRDEGQQAQLQATSYGPGQSSGEKAGRTDAVVDALPINLAFTHTGLQALQLDETTLKSFPDVFKEGMAARADRLGDTGASAPENWEGELGSRSVHGYFSGGFQAEDKENRVPEKYWRRLRDDVRAFNGRSGSRGKFLRRILGILFRLFGMEILHIELGQTPYRADGPHVDLRLEHFGFRDGISQPFIDMNLGKPPAGGGRVRRDRTWDPVAKGEIFLGHPDEDGNVHMQPFNCDLRHNGTFLVFRKLQQDVVGFREFLKQQRPDDELAQKRLAAEFMGRWQNGTPLSVSPHTPLKLTDDNDPRLNDFRFLKDDPDGRKCPLGSHVRRTNPRDIGGPDSVKRHRILRRSMAYGGPLLEEGSLGDGEEKGLLFIAANARIDLQFEVVQGNWINKGEFLGQAGLGRCPVTGANDGGIADSFLESGAAAPVTRLPRFVTTRGGDYFFMPSVRAIHALAGGCKFPPDEKEAARTGDSVGGRPTPELFERSRIGRYMMQFMHRKKRSITVDLPAMPSDGNYHEDELTGHSFLFLGRHADVCRVLKDNASNDCDDFLYSVPHYRQASKRTSHGPDLLIGTENGPVTGETRQRLRTILAQAWSLLPGPQSRLATIVEESLEGALQRTSGSGRIDLVQDLAVEAAYRVSTEIFGIPGPDWLTEIAVASQFDKQHLGQLEPDWLGTLDLDPPENPALTTLYLWSMLFLIDLANLPLFDDAKSIARTSGSEFTTHLDALIDKAHRHRPDTVETLLDACVKIEPKMRDQFGYGSEEYYQDVTALLLELSGTVMSVVPSVWGGMVNAMLDNRIDLTTLVPILKLRSQPNVHPTGIERLIYEMDRLFPFFSILMRHSEKDHDIDDKLHIPASRWIAALVRAANLDCEAFPQPKKFSLAPLLPGPERDIGNYLLFGGQTSERHCWGRDKLALFMLSQLVEKTSRLEGLRKLAGPAGEPTMKARFVVNLRARYSGVTPKPDKKGP